MAKIVMLTNPKTGVMKKGFYGFSWTMLLFGGFVPLFRGDVAMGVLLILLYFITSGLGTIIYAFFYNKQYTTKLLDQGYVFTDSPEKVAAARAKLGVLELV